MLYAISIFKKEIDLELDQALSVLEISLELPSGDTTALTCDIKQLGCIPAYRLHFLVVLATVLLDALWSQGFQICKSNPMSLQKVCIVDVPKINLNAQLVLSPTDNLHPRLCFLYRVDKLAGTYSVCYVNVLIWICRHLVCSFLHA